MAIYFKLTNRPNCPVAKFSEQNRFQTTKELYCFIWRKILTGFYIQMKLSYFDKLNASRPEKETAYSSVCRFGLRQTCMVVTILLRQCNDCGPMRQAPSSSFR